MTFEIAFHLYSCYLQDVKRQHASSREYIAEYMSKETEPGGSWILAGETDRPQAEVWPDGSVDLFPSALE